MATDWSQAPKDPQAIRDYAIDWTADLGTATIVGSTWAITMGGDGDAPLIVVEDDFTDTLTRVRLSGGNVNTTVALTNHIVMSDGEEDEQSGKIKIKDR